MFYKFGYLRCKCVLLHIYDEPMKDQDVDTHSALILAKLKVENNTWGTWKIIP